MIQLKNMRFKVFNMGGVLAAIILPVGLTAPVGVMAQVWPLGSPLEQQGTTDSRQSDRPEPGDINTNGRSVFEPNALGPSGGTPGQTMEEREGSQDNALGSNIALRPAPEPGEFEQYVSDIADRPVPRFGQDLLLPASRDFAVPSTAAVPPDYRLNVGDTVVLYLSGSLSGTVEREIDNDGNIFLPSVGTVRIAGVRYADLRQTVTQEIGREYRYFEVSVSIKALRGIRVYVTGFANNPGAFTLGSLSTLANAVFQAGGPSAGGSFRSVKLYRNGSEVADFDLYQLLRGANRTDDLVLQNEDVLFIPPAGEQVAVLGSVKDEAIYELRGGETLGDALTLAGGPSVLGEPDRLILYRTSEVPRRGPQEITADASETALARSGDIVHVLSRGTLLQPIENQSVVVRIEGEVNTPGNYYVAANTSLEELLAMAGGTTGRAFIYASRLERRSVREQQRRSFAEALEHLEFMIASAPLVNNASGNRSAAELASTQQVLELLRNRVPDGRVVMNLQPTSTAFPANVLLEQEDRLVIPARPTTIGVFGAVYRPASFLIENNGLRLRDYIERTGGTQRAADSRKAFVVRANGSVLTRGNGMLNETALPGDIVFVPVRSSTTDIWQRIQDFTAIVFQVGLTAAAVNSIK